MYYKLDYESPTTSISEEFKCDKDTAQSKAWEMLDENGRDGDVIISRRHSEYFGDFDHYLTCGFVKDPNKS